MRSMRCPSFSFKQFQLYSILACHGHTSQRLSILLLANVTPLNVWTYFFQKKTDALTISMVFQRLRSKNPKIQKPKNPKIQKSKNPQIQKSKNPKIQSSKNPKTQKSKVPKIQKSKVWKSALALSGRAGSQTSKVCFC